MRSILVRGYFEMDTDIVWQTVQKDVPALKPAAEAMLWKLEELGYGG